MVVPNGTKKNHVIDRPAEVVLGFKKRYIGLLVVVEFDQEI